MQLAAGGNLSGKAEAAPADPFDLFKTHFLSWFMPLLLCVGFCGTAINLVIIVKCRVFQKTTAVLFSALAVADLLNLVFAASYLYVSVYWDLDPMQLSPTGCRLVPYLEAIGYWLSPWIQATISFHRMLAIRYPLKVRHWLTVKRTRNILAILSTLVAAYAVVIPVCHTWQPVQPRVATGNATEAAAATALLSTQHHRRQLRCDKESRKFLVYYSHGLFGSIAPFFIMVLCTSLIVYLVCQTRRDVATTLEQLSAKQSQTLRAAHRLTINRQQQQQQRQQHRQKSKSSRAGTVGGSEKRVTLVLVLMNLTYFLTNGFAGLFLISKVHLMAAANETDFARLWATLHRFADVCACLNNSTNWIFYLLTGRKFREQFLRVLRCRTEQRQQQKQQQQQQAHLAPQQAAAGGQSNQNLQHPAEHNGIKPYLPEMLQSTADAELHQLPVVLEEDDSNRSEQLVLHHQQELDSDSLHLLPADYVSTV